jgi:hypothetical protein
MVIERGIVLEQIAQTDASGAERPELTWITDADNHTIAETALCNGKYRVVEPVGSGRVGPPL